MSLGSTGLRSEADEILAEAKAEAEKILARTREEVAAVWDEAEARRARDSDAASGRGQPGSRSSPTASAR
jgi:vacuolar-type H+-ATPase subunit E/Vma4